MLLDGWDGTMMLMITDGVVESERELGAVASICFFLFCVASSILLLGKEGECADVWWHMC